MDLFRYLPIEKFLHDQKKEFREFFVMDSVEPQIIVLERSLGLQKEELFKKVEILNKLKVEASDTKNYSKRKIAELRKIIRKATSFLQKNEKLKEKLKKFQKSNQDSSFSRFISSQCDFYSKVLDSRGPELRNKIDSEEREILRLSKMSDEECKMDLQGKILAMEDFVARENDTVKRIVEEIKSYKTLKTLLTNNQKEEEK